MIQTLEIVEGTKLPQPLAGQAAFFKDWTTRYVALSGGWGSGKTFVGARSFLDCVTYNSYGADGSLTHCGGAIIGATYRDTVTIAVRELLTAADERGLCFKFNTQMGEVFLPDLELTIYVRSAQAPETIRGFQAPLIWMDEAASFQGSPESPSNDTFIQAMGRMRHPLAKMVQLRVTTTPEGDGTRYHKLFYTGNPDFKVYTTTTIENTELPEEMREGLGKNLSTELYNQYILGMPLASGQGLIYSAFNRTEHVEVTQPLSGVPFLLAFDFNIEPGMHGLLVQFKENNFYVLREFYARRASVVELCGMIHEMLPDVPMFQVYGDATGRSEWSGIGKSNYYILQETMSKLGHRLSLRVPKANPQVQDRVNAMNSALRSVDGHTNLYIDPSCTELIEDFEQMSWTELGGITQYDKKRSHSSDALGYLVNAIRPCRPAINRSGYFGYC